MKQIDVDLDVFAAIWSNRQADEDCENDVLRRLLRISTAEQQPEAPAVQGEKEPLTNDTKEVKTSGFPTKLGEPKEIYMGKIRWVDDIVASLMSLGGQASLHLIYKDVEKRRRDGNRSVPKTIDAVIRRTLEDHSSDSANFRGEDLFALVGRGEWRLR